MSVLIKGMEMPKSCSECACCGYYGKGDHVCDITGKDVVYELSLEKRRDDCPLVELPPHGRLIDADALITTFCEWGTRLERSRKLVITMCEAKQAIVVIIEDATTIIEAEVSE